MMSTHCNCQVQLQCSPFFLQVACHDEHPLQLSSPIAMFTIFLQVTCHDEHLLLRTGGGRSASWDGGAGALSRYLTQHFSYLQEDTASLCSQYKE